MYQENLVFDSVSDVKKVEPFGFVDLVKANVTGSIPANIAPDQLSFNEIDDPNSIGARPSDTFEAMQAAKVITGYKSPESSSNEE